MNTLQKIVQYTCCSVALLAGNACSPPTENSAGADGGHAMPPPASPPKTSARLELKAYTPYPYPFTTCVVCGMILDQHALTFVQGDYEIKVCSQADADIVKKTPEVYLAKLKQAYQTAKPNPLKTCVVCSMSIDDGFLPFVYEGRQFQVCDKDCLAEFQKDPAKYTAIWDEAAKSADASKK